MSSIIKKSSSRFTPKHTLRKQSQPNTAASSLSPAPQPIQKTVHIQEPPEKIISEDHVEPNVEINDSITLKKDIFENNRDNNTSTLLQTERFDEAVIDDAEDPKRRSSTVIINPNILSNKSRRSSSTVSTTPNYRRGSVNDENIRIRRLSSITTGLGSGMASLRRPSASSLTSTPPPGATTVDASAASTIDKPTTSATPFKIEIPTSLPSSKLSSGSKLRSAGKIAKRASTSSSSRRSKSRKLSTTPGPDVAPDQIIDADTPAFKQSQSQERVQVIVPSSVDSDKARDEQDSANEDGDEMEVDEDDEEDTAGAGGSALHQDRTLKQRSTRFNFAPRSEQRLRAKGDAPESKVSKKKTAKKLINVKKKTSRQPEVRYPKMDGDQIDQNYTTIVDLNNKIQIVPKNDQLTAEPAAVQPSSASHDSTGVIDSLSDIPKDFLKNGHTLFSDVTINEDKMTMAELCSNIFPVGKPSENFLMATLAAKKKREELVQRRKWRIAARQEGKLYEDVVKEQEELARLERREKLGKDSRDELDKRRRASSKPSLKLLINEKGDFKLDLDSMLVDRHAARGEDDREKVTENEFENPTISSSYGKRRITDKWTTSELNTLYRALSTWGTDFNIITQLFPHRNRRQIKLKFNLEEKKHPHVVDLALKRKLPIDFEKYCSETKKEFKTLEEYNQELRQLKETHDRRVKEMELAREKQRKEDLAAQRQREVEIRSGVKAGSRKDRAAALRMNEVVVGEVGATKQEP